MGERSTLAPLSTKHRGAHVVVAGAGGNIGSSLIRHLARMPEVGRLTLIDRDTYELRNLEGQDIEAADLGRPKALVQAERVRAIAPELRVTPIVADLEALPMAVFASRLILTCLDSRRGRQAVNEIAWRLGVDWLDTGILADGLFVRLDSFRPAQNLPCIECGWTDDDYRAVEQEYLCTPETEAPGPSGLGAATRGVPPTGAPSALGALAASLQALEAGRLLRRSPDRLEPGNQVVLGADCHRMNRTARPLNPRCRFDHEVWRVDRLACQLTEFTLRELLAYGRSRLTTAGAVQLRVQGMRFVQEDICPACGRAFSVLRLVSDLSATHQEEGRDTRCPACGTLAEPTGWGLAEDLTEGDATPQELGLSLQKLGIRSLDVVTLRSVETDAEIHAQIDSTDGVPRRVGA